MTVEKYEPEEYEAHAEACRVGDCTRDNEKADLHIGLTIAESPAGGWDPAADRAEFVALIARSTVCEVCDVHLVSPLYLDGTPYIESCERSRGERYDTLCPGCDLSRPVSAFPAPALREGGNGLCRACERERLAAGRLSKLAVAEERTATRSSAVAVDKITPDTGETTLYRFWHLDDLLYIGIAIDPLSRWKQHRRDKAWFAEVDRFTIEKHPTRASALAAERRAIETEHPRHNVMHNSGDRVPSPEPAPARPTGTRTSPVQVGDEVALGLAAGRCPVGWVVALDEVWVSVRQKDFLTGGAGRVVSVHRWSDVQEMRAAYPEDRLDSGDFDDEHLSTFQTAWIEATS